jgi:hypothetical protein
LRPSNTPQETLRAWNTNIPLTRAAETAEARKAEKAEQSVDAHFDTQSATGHGTSEATGHGTSVAEIDEVTLSAETDFGELSGA